MTNPAKPGDRCAREDCHGLRAFHDASTHAFEPAATVVAREDRCREFVDQQIKSACARKSGHEGGHCIYDIDAACAASEPTPPTPDSSDDAAAREIAERWQKTWRTDRVLTTHEAIEGAVREALAEGRRLKRNNHGCSYIQKNDWARKCAEEIFNNSDVYDEIVDIIETAVRKTLSYVMNIAQTVHNPNDPHEDSRYLIVKEIEKLGAL